MVRILLAVVLGALLAPPGSAFEIEQLTCLPVGCAHSVLDLSITGDGKRILFTSACDLDPGQNPHRVDQIFQLDLATRRVRQLTPPALDWARARDVPCGFHFSADATGDRIAILADCGSSPEDFRMQLLEYRGAPGQLEPLGPPLPCAMEVAMAGDGSRLAVTSECRPDRRTRRKFRDFFALTKLYLREAPGRPFKRWHHRGRRACRVAYPQLSHDGQVVVVASECPLEPRSNPERGFQIYRFDRTGRGPRRVNPPGCNVSVNKPPPLFTMDPPTLSADGEAVVFSSGGCGTGRAFLGDSHIFRRRRDGELEQLTFGFCMGREHPPFPDILGYTIPTAPLAVSRDGRTIAYTLGCDERPVFTDVTDHVVLYRDGAAPQLVELFSAPSTVHNYEFMSPVSMDLEGSSLVVSAPRNTGGCPSSGGNQLYLVRNLQDPTPGPTTCACGPPIR